MKKLVLLSLLFVLSCEPKGKPTVQAFYFWRNHLNISDIEATYLKKSNSDFLYTRFFDVDKKEGKFVPIGLRDQIGNFHTTKKIVPVIFIVNRVWHNITSDEIDFLVDKIVGSIMDKASYHNLDLAQEIQIDSDWTATTQQDYFLFLKKLKEASQGKVSCTIRLHQVKDREETGIPPVDKGYLMCYATSSPLEESKINSILDVDLLKKYLSNLSSYPMDLDMAFPIYSWGIVSNHLGKKKLLNAVSIHQLSSSPNFEQLDESTFRITKDGFYFGMYMNQGFTIKVEEVSEKIIQESITFINQNYKQPYQLVWYHLDERFLSHYPNLLQ